MPTDDERLLVGEVRRALERHRRIRELVEILHEEGLVQSGARDKILELTREEQG